MSAARAVGGVGMVWGIADTSLPGAGQGIAIQGAGGSADFNAKPQQCKEAGGPLALSGLAVYSVSCCFLCGILGISAPWR
jgi:hypothetical protein